MGSPTTVDSSAPLTIDDLIDLHFLLEDDRLFLELLAATLEEVPA